MLHYLIMNHFIDNPRDAPRAARVCSSNVRFLLIKMVFKHLALLEFARNELIFKDELGFQTF